MAPPDAPAAAPNPIPDRVRLVIALTEVNSRHLRSEARRGGAEIELERALEDERLHGPTPVLLARIAEMQARSDESHCSTKPVRYALEMNKGWFAKRGILAGSRIRGGPLGK